MSDAQHLGDFGVQRPAVEHTFGYFGSTVRVNPGLTDLALIDLFQAVDDTEDGTAAVGGLLNMVRALIHPDDLDDFWKAAKSNHQSMEDIAQLGVQLIGALADRPTVRPSDSSAGPAPTDTSSEAVSSSPAIEALSGRPDLQVVVARAERAQQAS